jgi:acyl carrier protein
MPKWRIGLTLPWHRHPHPHLPEQRSFSLTRGIDMTTTFERMCAILIRDYKLQPDRLTLDAPLESLGIDSLGTVELLWNIEDVFQIKLPSDPVELPTLGDVVRYVDELVAKQGATSAAAPPGEPTLHSI